jgi:excisionase family DNA binding protein
MQAVLAESVAPQGGDDLVTTGEAGRLLGASRQHIVDLCTAGDLEFTRIGRHRRIRRRDIERLANAGDRLTRDQLRSLLLAYAVAGRLVIDPEASLALARRNLARMRQSSSRGAARIWIDEWAHLIEGSLPELLAALTSRSPRSRELRQNTPFAGVLSEEERLSVLANLPTARKTEPA